MKKVFFTAFAALAFAFTMTACGGDNKTTDSIDSTAVTAEKPCEHKCAHECDTTKCCQKVEGEACEHKCEKAEGQECCKKAEGQECENKCAKAEGKECCKKAEGKECEHKCQK